MIPRRVWGYAACLAFFPAVQFVAGIVGDRIHRRHQPLGPLPNVVPITNRRNPA